MVGTFELSEIAELIKLAIAPVFLLTGVGAVLTVLSARLSRIVDRARMLEEQLLKSGDATLHDYLRAELVVLSRRLKLGGWAIGLCVSAEILICILIALLFVGGLFSVDVAPYIAGLFIAAMALLILGLWAFLREIHLGLHSVRIGGRLALDFGEKPP